MDRSSEHIYWITFLVLDGFLVAWKIIAQDIEQTFFVGSFWNPSYC
jgi:hypothetical protein